MAKGEITTDLMINKAAFQRQEGYLREQFPGQFVAMYSGDVFAASPTLSELGTKTRGAPIPATIFQVPGVR